MTIENILSTKLNFKVELASQCKTERNQVPGCDYDTPPVYEKREYTVFSHYSYDSGFCEAATKLLNALYTGDPDVKKEYLSPNIVSRI